MKLSDLALWLSELNPARDPEVVFRTNADEVRGLEQSDIRLEVPDGCDETCFIDLRG
jgi:hypothetical protein